ncbi:uncharacterized protein LOC133814725 [Humulus lupulus]|uniref:uncharacterized protein LOC133814725 n=1 Tax=Humulus lupulus TaxID=3486 RepID=UPI002B40E52D|nr:uncharacterized protein LOC133814725 [Humulus lupulus]
MAHMQANFCSHSSFGSHSRVNTIEVEAPIDTAPEIEAPMDITPDVEAPINTTPEVEVLMDTTPEVEAPVHTNVKCKLYIGQGGDVVALGQVVATKGNVHGKSLAPGNYRVVVDRCLDGSAKLPVSVGDEMTLVVHAVNSYVAWPSHLIITYDHEQEPKRLKRKRISAACPPTQDLKHPPQHLPTTQEEAGSSMANKSPIIFKVPTGLPMFLKILLGSVKYVEPRFMIDILMETNIMGEQYTFYISHENIVQFGLMEEIGASCISFYIKEISHFFGFIEPSWSLRIGTNMDNQAEIISERINNTTSLDCGGKNTYTLGEINESRNEWAAKLLERMSHS